MKDKIIKKLITDEFRLHPEAELVDYYKLFYQGTFGPEHIIKDENIAYNFLKKEIKNNAIFEKEFYQDIGYLNKFYRVNLKVVKDGIISLDALFHAFLNSRKLEKTITRKECRQEWDLIRKIILEMNVLKKNPKDQIALFQKKIETNGLYFHHSKTFQEKYNPHYRVISQKEFAKLKI